MKRNVFRVSLPNTDVKRRIPQNMAIDSLLPNPKIDTRASPPHAGIIFLDWNTAQVVPYQTTKLLYSFPHPYGYIPTVIASYKYDAGSTKTEGVLPFTLGATGIIIMDADNANINLKYRSNDVPGTTNIGPFLMQIRFYVMAERGNE